jgi:signal transduction histidine kinase
VEWRLDPSPAPVRHHPGNLGLAFRNLADNARRAAGEGGWIRISSEALEGPADDGFQVPPGRWVHIGFQDSGPGIPPEVLPRIFDPYFSTRERGSERGLGLGLALCQAIVGSHQGAISAEARPGEGARFHVLLPVAGQCDPDRP